MGVVWFPQDSVRYLRMYLVDSVFPAPDSPDTMMDWLTLCVFMSLYDLSANGINRRLFSVNLRVPSYERNTAA